MKNILLIFVFISAFSYLSDAQLRFGAGANLWLEGKATIGLQGLAVYSVTDEIDVEGAFTYYLGDFPNYGVDIIGRYNLMTLGEDIKFAPLAGFNYTDAGFFNFTSFQIGANFEKPIGGLTIFLEPRIVFSGSTFQMNAGVIF